MSSEQFLMCITGDLISDQKNALYDMPEKEIMENIIFWLACVSTHAYEHVWMMGPSTGRIDLMAWCWVKQR